MAIIKPYEEKFPSILVFGNPGSGKRMLGEQLQAAGTHFHLSMGDILRSLGGHTPAGELYFSYASKGKLLPDAAIVEIWRYYVQGLVATNAFYPDRQSLVLDGLPRTLAQAKLIEPFIEIKHIIVLQISEEQELFTRMRKRSREEGHLEELEDGHLQEQVSDYEKHLSEILSYYEPPQISKIDAEQRPLEVLRDVLVRLSHLL